MIKLSDAHKITKRKAQYVINNNVKCLLSGVIYRGNHKTEIKKSKEGCTVDKWLTRK